MVQIQPALNAMSASVDFFLISRNLLRGYVPFDELKFLLGTHSILKVRFYNPMIRAEPELGPNLSVELVIFLSSGIA